MKFFVVCGAALLSLSLTIQAHGAERATTAELPAALKGLGFSPARILTSEQARQVRGEGGRKFGPHHPATKFPANHYSGHRKGQDLKRGRLK